VSLCWQPRASISAPASTSPPTPGRTSPSSTARVTLPAAAGRQAATELLLTGRRVGGAEALALGLCDRLAGDAKGELLADALAFAGELAASGPLAVRAIRATLRDGLVEMARASMEHECAEQLALRDTADFAEGVRAAAERREPRFGGT